MTFDKINDKIKVNINNVILYGGKKMKKEDETFELKKSLSLLKEGVISLSSMLNKKIMEK